MDEETNVEEVMPVEIEETVAEEAEVVVPAEEVLPE